MNPMKRMLTDLEASVHRKGWDQPSVLGKLLRFPGALAVQEFPDFPQAHPPTVIRAFAQHAHDHPEIAEKFVRESPNMIGVVLINEGWAPPKDASVDELEKVRAAGKGYADMPGAREARIISTVDVFGNVWMTHRLRGEQVTVNKLGAGLNYAGGQIFQSLRTLLVVFAQYMPNGLKYVKTLTAIEFTDDTTVMKKFRESQGATRPNSSNAP